MILKIPENNLRVENRNWKSINFNNQFKLEIDKS